VSQPLSRQRFFIVGGAGFIGSHFCDQLLGPAGAAAVTIYDNYSSGRTWHHAAHDQDERFRVVRGAVEDTTALAAAMDGHDVVIHLASNPDIARAAREPTIDFTQGTALTQSVVEAMRVTSAKRILYASGSGVYGELGTVDAQEDHGPLIPVSTYGASKLAGEALIASYAYMFDLRGCGFRFGNVVGPRQTHGVGFDFVRRLIADPTQLAILGDGTQSKSYIHVTDVVAAVLRANQVSEAPYAAFNVATGDYITVTEIAKLAIEVVGIAPGTTALRYGGGNRGWKGDVPVIRLDTAKIRGLGWECRRNAREALRASMAEMLDDARAGRL